MTVKDYTKKLSKMDDEELGSEFASRIGNECGDFERLMYHRGRGFVINYLSDYYEVESADDTTMDDCVEQIKGLLKPMKERFNVKS